uniref:CSON009479 protein n=1 Tax=Culicoides sonorensis TaxID=179676 RepID=A0A336M0F5_CULSO
METVLQLSADCSYELFQIVIQSSPLANSLNNKVLLMILNNNLLENEILLEVFVPFCCPVSDIAGLELSLLLIEVRLRI